MSHACRRGREYFSRHDTFHQGFPLGGVP
jgi:hypothetical protein